MEFQPSSDSKNETSELEVAKSQDPAPKQVVPRSRDRTPGERFEGNRHLLQILLHNDGEDAETVWTEVISEQGDGSKLVRLLNIPIVHAVPTYGDTFQVTPNADDDWLERNMSGVTGLNTAEYIHEPGGFQTMVVSYVCDDPTQLKSVCKWINQEHGFMPQPSLPGKLHLAVPSDSRPADVMSILAQNTYGYRFKLEWP